MRDRHLAALVAAVLTAVPAVTPVASAQDVVSESAYTRADSLLATRRRLAAVLQRVDQFGRAHEGLPSSLAAVLAPRDLHLAKDIWGTPYRFRPAGFQVEIVSAGPDLAFGSTDDISIIGRLGRQVPCGERVEGRWIAPLTGIPECADVQDVLILPLCPELVSSKPVREIEPRTSADTVALTGRRLVRFARAVDRAGREFGALPPTVRRVLGYPRVEDGWEFRDGWGRAVRYSPDGTLFELRSPGADGAFGSADDIFVRAELGEVIPCLFRTEEGDVTCPHPPPTCGSPQHQAAPCR